MAIVFEWDPRKESLNLRKHGISFAEASTVLDDGLARIFKDTDHSEIEAREIIIGHSAAERLLLVIFTERKPDRIRIISAREVSRQERRDYEEAS